MRHIPLVDTGAILLQRTRRTTSNINTDDPVWIPYANRVASFYSSGGPNLTEVNPQLRDLPEFLQNCIIGGGTRKSIYGSARWGSGDGYWYNGSSVWIPTSALNVLMRPFPFGFWPISWGSDNYGGSGGYYNDTYRPGGVQSMIIANLQQVPTNSRAFYFIIGDNSTISGLNNLLQSPVDEGGCNMYGGNPVYLFRPDDLKENSTRTLSTLDGSPNPRQNVTISPEMVLHYYRTSSVALGYGTYNNYFSLNNNTNPSYWSQTLFDIPADSTNSTTERAFLFCLNQTIAAAIPIVNEVYASSPSSGGTSARWLIGVWVGVGALVIGTVLCVAVKPWRRIRATRTRTRLGKHTGGRRVIVTNHRLYGPIYDPSGSSPAQPLSALEAHPEHMETLGPDEVSQSRDTPIARPEYSEQSDTEPPAYTPFEEVEQRIPEQPTRRGR